MSKDISEFRSIIMKNGYRLTKAREETFKLLISQQPQTINEIIKKSKGKVDRVSIYRNIELFEKLGIINRVYTGWKYKIELSDDFVAHHHHLNCIKCDKVIDIEDEDHIDEFIQSTAEKVGFTPRRHLFEIDGICRECNNKNIY